MLYYNANGSLKDAKEVYYNASGSLKTVKEVWYNANGSLKLVWPSYSYDGKNFYGQLKGGLILNYHYPILIGRSDYDSYNHYNFNDLGENTALTSGPIELYSARSFYSGGYSGDYTVALSNFRSKDKIDLSSIKKIKLTGRYDLAAWSDQSWKQHSADLRLYIGTSTNATSTSPGSNIVKLDHTYIIGSVWSDNYSSAESQHPTYFTLQIPISYTGSAFLIFEFVGYGSAGSSNVGQAGWGSYNVFIDKIEFLR